MNATNFENYPIFLAFLELSLSKKFYTSEICRNNLDGEIESCLINANQHTDNYDVWSRYSQIIYGISEEYLNRYKKLPKLIVEQMETKLIEEEVLISEVNLNCEWVRRHYEAVNKMCTLTFSYTEDLFTFIDSYCEIHKLDTRQFVGHAYRSLLTMHRTCCELGQLNVSKR